MTEKRRRCFFIFINFFVIQHSRFASRTISFFFDNFLDASNRDCCVERCTSFFLERKSSFTVDKLHHTVGDWYELLMAHRAVLRKIVVQLRRRCTLIKIFFRDGEKNCFSEATLKSEKKTNELGFFVKLKRLIVEA